MDTPIIDLEGTLKERGGNYGDAMEHFNTTKNMYNVFKKRLGSMDDVRMCNMVEHVAYMICDKLARASHNPYHLDNWRDIQGYAKLLEKELGK